MARNRRKMSPYEVIGQSRSKSSFGKTLKKLPPEKSDSGERATAESAMPASERATHWLGKPKLVQFNAGRIEISLPYPLAIAVLLGIILLFLVALWLGETGYLSRTRITNSARTVLQGRRTAAGGGMVGSDENERISPDAGKTVTGTGNNRVVIQTFDKRADLEQVQYHFAEGGIETEIKKIGDTFYLRTVDKYEKAPKIEGTDGYAALQRIIKWGARYEAPQGYESFASNLFSDAYGKKFDD